MLILTGVRTNPLRHIYDNQIDGTIWIIPAENMKGRRDTTTEFRVPLSSEALKVIEQSRCLSKSNFLFSFSGSAPFNVNCMALYMQRARIKACSHRFLL